MRVAMHKVVRYDPPKVVLTERRRARRFSLELKLRYRTLNRPVLEGNGKTVNISSFGVLFISDQELPVGMRLDLFICWPAQLNDNCLLNLVVRGSIVRHAKGLLALEIQDYVFRTRGVKPAWTNKQGDPTETRYAVPF